MFVSPSMEYAQLEFALTSYIIFRNLIQFVKEFMIASCVCGTLKDYEDCVHIK